MRLKRRTYRPIVVSASAERYIRERDAHGRLPVRDGCRCGAVLTGVDLHRHIDAHVVAASRAYTARCLASAW
jgi:hypothetical protein